MPNDSAQFYHDSAFIGRLQGRDLIRRNNSIILRKNSIHISLDVFRFTINQMNLNRPISCCSGAIRREKPRSCWSDFTKRELPFRLNYPEVLLLDARPTVVIDISVDSTRASEIAQIHRDLFGDGLPN